VKPKGGGCTKVQKKDCNWSTVVLYRIYRPSTVGKTVGTVVTLVLQYYNKYKCLLSADCAPTHPSHYNHCHCHCG
jgi:hypothetical protein